MTKTLGVVAEHQGRFCIICKPLLAYNRFYPVTATHIVTTNISQAGFFVNPFFKKIQGYIIIAPLLLYNLACSATFFVVSIQHFSLSMVALPLAEPLTKRTVTPRKCSVCVAVLTATRYLLTSTAKGPATLANVGARGGRERRRVSRRLG